MSKNKTNERPARVLLAEDDKYIQRAFCDSFRRHGLELIAATDGEEAVALAKKRKPDLVILDLIMPKKDGFEVMAELRRGQATKGIPVIVFSNVEDEAGIERARELGAVEYLLKANFTLPQVIDKVKKYIKEK